MTPETIRILGKIYRVSRKVMKKSFGQCDHGQLKITINPKQAKQQEQDTVLHEVIHAVEYGMQLEMEEEQVHSLASGLYAVLRDNPKLVKYLLK